MILTSEQEQALDDINTWMKKPSSEEWMFYLSGYAGTGKTTLIQHLINGLDSAPLCLAPTGKAASVLQKKLQKAEVSTIHSALYRVVPPNMNELLKLEQALITQPNDNRIIEALKEERERLSKKRISFTSKDDVAILPESLVIVDEASMVTSRMLSDLKNTNAKVLFVGDSGQLPPVGDAGYFLKQTPNAMLSTVQRQALDNPIIRLSMDIRQGKPIPSVIRGDRVTKGSKAMLPPTAYKEADQVLTGTNRVRMNLNQTIRRLSGYSGKWPVPGEKLICLKNDRRDGRFFTNGVQCFCTSEASYRDDLGEWQMGLLYEGVSLPALSFYTYFFEVYIDKEVHQDPLPMREGLVELDFGYAITVHKSQGSEWDKVLLVDDGMNRNDPAFRKRWLYTAVTRAKESLTWVS